MISPYIPDACIYPMIVKECKELLRKSYLDKNIKDFN